MVLADPEGVSVGVSVMGERFVGDVKGATSPVAIVGVDPAPQSGGTADSAAEAEPGNQWPSGRSMVGHRRDCMLTVGSIWTVVRWGSPLVGKKREEGGA